MVKASHGGYTLPEILIGLMIVSLMAAFVLPDMRALLDKQGLKVKIARLQTYVDQARHLAATTECPVRVTLNPNQDAIDVQLAVQRDTFMRGCSAWHSQTTNPEELTWSISLEGLTLEQNALLEFKAVSGALNSSHQTRLVLSHKSSQAQVIYFGIGHGMVEYVQ